MICKFFDVIDCIWRCEIGMLGSNPSCWCHNGNVKKSNVKVTRQHWQLVGSHPTQLTSMQYDQKKKPKSNLHTGFFYLAALSNITKTTTKKEKICKNNRKEM